MKKKNFKFYNLYNILAILLLIISICMLFVKSTSLGAKAANNKMELSFTPVVFTGYEAALGKEGLLKFSFMNLFTYILAFISIILLIINICDFKKLRKISVLPTILILVCGIFFFLSGVFMVPESLPTFPGVIQTKNILVGGVVAGICSLLASFCSLLALIQKNRK